MQQGTMRLMLQPHVAVKTIRLFSSKGSDLDREPMPAWTVPDSNAGRPLDCVFPIQAGPAYNVSSLPVQ